MFYILQQSFFNHSVVILHLIVVLLTFDCIIFSLCSDFSCICFNFSHICVIFYHIVILVFCMSLAILPVFWIFSSTAQVLLKLFCVFPGCLILLTSICGNLIGFQSTSDLYKSIYSIVRFYSFSYVLFYSQNNKSSNKLWFFFYCRHS